MTTFTLDAMNARPTMARAWDEAQRIIGLGKRASVKVDEAKSRRTLDQNAKFHAICHEVAQQCVWAGKARDAEAWKRLFLDAWARATQRRQVEIVPSLDGESVVHLGVQSRSLPVDDMSELLEFVIAWCADNQVELHS
jgi:hypothetical protein